MSSKTSVCIQTTVFLSPEPTEMSFASQLRHAKIENDQDGSTSPLSLAIDLLLSGFGQGRFLALANFPSVPDSYTPHRVHGKTKWGTNNLPGICSSSAVLEKRRQRRWCAGSQEDWGPKELARLAAPEFSCPRNLHTPEKTGRTSVPLTFRKDGGCSETT